VVNGRTTALVAAERGRKRVLVVFGGGCLVLDMAWLWVFWG
jgi:3-dehydroquinate synthetase